MSGGPRRVPAKVALAEKLALFSTHWDPKIVAELNGQQVRLVRLLGEFVWHAHPAEDELFLVLAGELRMRLRDPRGEERVEILGPGELLVVPRGVEHCPVADREVEVLLFEPASTSNTGDAGGARTVAAPERI